MNWSDIKSTVGAAAPILGSLLGGPAGGAVGAMIASTLGVDDNPLAVANAIQADPGAALKLKEIQDTNRAHLEGLRIAAETTRITEINRTMRSELQHEGVFKSGWRPMIGWVLAFSIAGLMSGLVYSIFKTPELTGEVISQSSLIISLMLGVLGINITSRSSDKRSAMGVDSTGLIASIAAKLRK